MLQYLKISRNYYKGTDAIPRIFIRLSGSLNIVFFSKTFFFRVSLCSDLAVKLKIYYVPADFVFSQFCQFSDGEKPFYNLLSSMEQSLPRVVDSYSVNHKIHHYGSWRFIKHHTSPLIGIILWASPNYFIFCSLGFISVFLLHLCLGFPTGTFY